MSMLLSTSILGAGAQSAPPEATVSSRQLRVHMYLPDPDNGFYRGARFDWSGMVSRVEFAGHSFYGQWFTRVDPATRDVGYNGEEVLVSRNTSAVGPAQEFQTPLGYDAAKAGDPFIKIGVGVLKKGADTRYAFANVYDILDHGTWTVTRTASSVEFTQDLSHPATGYAYRYKKTVRVVDDRPEMVMEHSLENTGRLPIASLVYNHNFTAFDGLPTGDITVSVPYEITSTRLPEAGAATISGKQFAYTKAVEGTERVSAGLQGFGPTTADHDFRIEHRKAGAGIRVQGDRPLRDLALWSMRTTVALEPFIEVAADPGQTFTWRSTYTFYTLPQ